MTIDEYLNKPYTIRVVHDRDDDGNEGFVASVEELPGVFTQGGTLEEAVAGIRDAMAGWISVALEDGIPIPEPRDPNAYSGRFLLRIPKSLHADLARRAEEEGVSLNQFVTAALAEALGRRQLVA